MRVALPGGLPKGWTTEPALPRIAAIRRGSVVAGWLMVVVVAASVLAGLDGSSHTARIIAFALLATTLASAWALFAATVRTMVAELLALLGLGLSGAALYAAVPTSAAYLLTFVALAGMGLRLPTATAVRAAVVVLVATDAAIVLGRHDVASDLASIDLGASFMLVVALFTRSSRQAADRADALVEQTLASQQAQEQAAALAERARLAREIHDILAHALSGLVLSLDAARLLGERTGADVRVLEQVERAQRLARDGLADTRRAIQALRGDPLPGPEVLRRLVEDAVAHGTAAELEVLGSPRPLPAEVGLAVYRTAQETLTNSARHAGAGARVRMQLRYTSDAVLLTVTDVRGAGASAAAGLPTGGFGLAGLRERAELLGGTLEAQATSDGFRVCLTIPADPAAAAESLASPGSGR